MDRKRFLQIRAVVALFISVIVAIATINDSYLLAISGVLTGMVFLIFARSKTKITIDERERTIREKAAQLTYAIFTPMLGIGALILTFVSKEISADLQKLGMIFSYLTFSLIALYSISYYYLNRNFSGSSDEE
jgi:uncharacterized membrane protein